MMIWWFLRYLADSQLSHLCGASSSVKIGNRLSNMIPTSSTYTTPVHSYAQVCLLLSDQDLQTTATTTTTTK
ncbi:hypothetical protein LINPERPRIM_LOCUS34309 [Linum perenne]